MGAVVWLVVIPVLLLIGIFLKSYVLSLSPDSKFKSRNSRLLGKGNDRQYSQEAKAALAENSLSKEHVEEVITQGKPSKASQGVKYKHRLPSGKTVVVVLGQNEEVLQVWV